MKKVFVIFIMILASLNCKIHPWDSILKEGKRFFMESYSYAVKYEIFSEMEYIVSGDTIIDGIKYKRLICDGKYIGAACEDNGKLYGYNDPTRYYITDIAPMPIETMDMNIQDGDFYFGTGPASVDIVSIKGKSRKRVRFPRGSSYNEQCVWIEGVGLSDEMHNLSKINGISGGLGARMYACIEDGEVIFDGDDFHTEESTQMKPILSLNKKWELSIVARDNPSIIIDRLTASISNDTILNGRKCYVLDLVYDSDPSAKETHILYESYMSLYLYDKQFIYNLDVYDRQPVFLMSFNPDYLQTFREVIERDNIMARGQYFDRIRLYKPLQQSGDTGYWIEGVGFSSSEFMHFNFDAYDSQNVIVMDACYENDECTFTAEDFSNSSVPSIDSDETAIDEPCFDLMGRRVISPNPGDIVIKGKQKIFVK